MSCGTITGHSTHGCRCADCKQARYRYDKQRMGRKRQGPLMVSAVGALRRIQALQAIGWPLTEIAAQCGRSRNSRLLNQGCDRVYIGTHLRICAVYEALSGTPGPSQRARTCARRNGWPPPLAWDDEALDNANVPAPAGYEYRPFTRQELVAERNARAAELAAKGLTNRQIANELGCEIRQARHYVASGSRR